MKKLNFIVHLVQTSFNFYSPFFFFLSFFLSFFLYLFFFLFRMFIQEDRPRRKSWSVVCLPKRTRTKKMSPNNISWPSINSIPLWLPDCWSLWFYTLFYFHFLWFVYNSVPILGTKRRDLLYPVFRTWHGLHAFTEK